MYVCVVWKKIMYIRMYVCVYAQIHMHACTSRHIYRWQTRRMPPKSGEDQQPDVKELKRKCSSSLITNTQPGSWCQQRAMHRQGWDSGHFILLHPRPCHFWNLVHGTAGLANRSLMRLVSHITSCLSAWRCRVKQSCFLSRWQEE